MRLCLLMALMLFAGCTTERNGTVRYVIIGFGVVKVPSTNVVAKVTRVNAIGIYYSPFQSTLGYVASTVTEISPTVTNLSLEIK